MRPPLRLSSTDPKIPVTWSIAGFDPSSGAGVTADLMTFASHATFGCSAITALTVQTTQGVFAVEPIAADVLQATLTRLYDDLPPAGIKIGMLATAENVAVVAEFLDSLGGTTLPPVVLDPVLRSSSGRDLLCTEGLDLMRRHLLPRVDWITPNWAELAVLCERSVESMHDVEAAATHLGESFPQLHIVATGGDQAKPTDLVRLPGGTLQTFPGEHIETSSTHGTGCAFSSALLCNLVHAADALHAVQAAKHFVREALLRAPGLGNGKGPLGLLWPLQDGARHSRSLVP